MGSPTNTELRELGEEKRGDGSGNKKRKNSSGTGSRSHEKRHSSGNGRSSSNDDYNNESGGGNTDNNNNDHAETSTENDNSLPPAFKNITDPDPPLVGQEQNGATENVLHGSDGTDNNGDTAAAQSVLESVEKFE